MRKHGLRISSLFLFIGVFFTGSAWAGQVVTKELSQWARQAIANEQTLAAIPSAKSVAVLYFQNLTGNASLNPVQKGLSVMLTTDLAKVKDLQVVERARFQAILEEIELGTTGLVDTGTAPRVGRLVGARFLSGGDILKGAVTQLQVAPNLLDATEQTIINQAAAEGDLNDLIAIEKEILFDIIRQMEIALTPDEKAELEKPISTSIPALMLLFRGIDASDHGKYAQAADLYEQALVKDPNLTPAKEALNEINALDLASQTVEKAPVKEAAPEVASAPKKSGGLFKWTAVGLGVVAVGAGGYFAATALNDDDEDDEDDDNGDGPPPEQGDMTRPTVTQTVPPAGSLIECFSGNIELHFSEPMHTSGYEINPSDSRWNITENNWENNNRTLIMEWENSGSDDGDICYYVPGSERIAFELSGFTDVTGNTLDNPTSFIYQY